MLGRAWVSELLIATLNPCASRSRLKPFSPNLNIPVTSIRHVDCDLFSGPSHGRNRCLHLCEGCEQLRGRVE